MFKTEGGLNYGGLGVSHVRNATARGRDGVEDVPPPVPENRSTIMATAIYCQLICDYTTIMLYQNGLPPSPFTSGTYALHVCNVIDNVGITIDFSALAVKFINDFSGPCTLQVREDSIAVKRSNGKEIGRWPYAFIREFRFDDERIQFSFMSGRRGIFGVADYLFKLHNRTYFNLRETVNRIASGRSSSGKSKPSDSKPPVPPHSRKSSTHKMQNAADMYDGLPVLRSLGHQRSTSNPNLAQELIEHLKPRSSFGDSTKSDPSQHGPPNCNMSHRGSTGGFLSQSNSPILDRVFRPHSPQPWSRTNLDSKDYQVPRPATESDYNVPRPLFDPRNDYQIPKPMDETYMVPRPVHEMRSQGRSDSSLLMLSALRETRETSKGLEHSYEDLDKAAVEKH